MAVEEEQGSDTTSMSYKLLQNDPAKGLAGLAEGLEPSSITEEELDDYEQVLADSQGRILCRSMLTHQCHGPSAKPLCWRDRHSHICLTLHDASGLDSQIYMWQTIWVSDEVLMSLGLESAQAASLGCSVLASEAPPLVAGVWQRGFPRHPPAAAEAVRQCIKGADARTAGDLPGPFCAESPLHRNVRALMGQLSHRHLLALP